MSLYVGFTLNPAAAQFCSQNVFIATLYNPNDCIMLIC